MSVNGECLGVRVEDWRAVCEDKLPAATVFKIEQAIRARCKKRNREAHARDAELQMGGGCATHRD